MDRRQTCEQYLTCKICQHFFWGLRSLTPCLGGSGHTDCEKLWNVTTIFIDAFPFFGQKYSFIPSHHGTFQTLSFVGLKSVQASSNIVCMFASRTVLRMTREERRHTPNSKVLSCHKAGVVWWDPPYPTLTTSPVLGLGPAIALVCSTAARGAADTGVRTPVLFTVH